MKIFAIIVTYNAMHRGWADRCLLSLHASTYPVTAVVVDNGSTDGTREVIPARFPDAVWLPQEMNIGFGQANNVGIRYAMSHQADYVLLLNQDAALAPDALEKMLKVSDGESLLSPLHLNGVGTQIDEMFRYSLRKANNRMLDDLLIRGTLLESYETGDICAACWLLPVALIRKIGGFNPLFFHYSEDNNYFHRMLFHHVKTILVPHAQMFHDRLLQGNLQVFNKKRLHRDLLIVATNINLSLKRRCIKWMAVLYRCYVHDLAQHTYFPGAWLCEMLWLIVHARKIATSRRKEKAGGLVWLGM